jgi:hypothetical protein
MGSGGWMVMQWWLGGDAVVVGIGFRSCGWRWLLSGCFLSLLNLGFVIESGFSSPSFSRAVSCLSFWLHVEIY